MSKQRSLLKDRSTLLTMNPSSVSNTHIIGLLEFTSYSDRIIRIIRKHWHILWHVPGCTDFPLIDLRRTKSIKNILVHTEMIFTHSIVNTSPTDHYKCGRCSSCPFSLQIKEIYDENSNFRFTIRQFSTCQTEDVVYLIRCPCNLLYIGSTTRAVGVRTGEHHSRIRNAVMEAPLVEHFITHHHSETDLLFTVLWINQKKCEVRQDSECLLRQQETRLIYLFKSIYPGRLNSELDFNCFT
ncbi:uncharacterized protein LOC144327564 [Podarcis muralis]